MNPKNLGIAGGIAWGLIVLVLTILSVMVGFGTDFLTLLTAIYPGYTVTLVGSVVGFVGGFLYTFILLYVLATVYNKLEEG